MSKKPRPLPKLVITTRNQGHIYCNLTHVRGREETYHPVLGQNYFGENRELKFIAVTEAARVFRLLYMKSSYFVTVATLNYDNSETAFERLREALKTKKRAILLDLQPFGINFGIVVPDCNFTERTFHRREMLCILARKRDSLPLSFGNSRETTGIFGKDKRYESDLEMED